MPVFKKKAVKLDLKSPLDKRVATGKTIWARLFRSILLELNITPSSWHRLMVRYMADPRNRVSSDRDERVAFRRRLETILRSPTMTAKQFETALKFLNPHTSSLEVKLDLHWNSGTTTKHKSKVDIELYGKRVPIKKD